ncbi:hypothetical protein M885DRAFT_506842 [Pelagophyceae sp. CCMP2097]|nr:hypothetical protein M885DRAFT_506842 [Pelagophyceae sp. CCMP2097]
MVLRTTVELLALVVAARGLQLAPQRTLQRARLGRGLRSSEEDLEDLEDLEEAAILAEAEEIAKKKRSNMYNENGVAYAPWMLTQVDEEAITVARAMRKDKKRLARKALNDVQGVVNILDAATSELSGIGLKAKNNDGEVELLWGTDSEEENRGFVVEKKSVGASEWEECASYRTWSPLKSKGTLGGAYTYVDSESAEGEWLYRIVAEQVDGSRAITCQVGISVENEGQQIQTKIVVGVSLLLFVSFLFLGAQLDPIRG